MSLFRRIGNQRGSILLFTTVLVVPLMIIIAGLAMDLAYYGSADDQLQRAMDAAALAGAGNLGFNSSAFPAARQAAQTYAIANPFRTFMAAHQISSTTFTQNTNNADTVKGNVILGIWDGRNRTFTPSSDGTVVNAVRCQYQTTVSTSFLRLIGITSLSTQADATAVSNPPNTLCPGCCLFPIGVTQCSFTTGGTPGSQGCGQPVSTFTSANVNTAAWIQTDPAKIAAGVQPSANDTKNAIDAAAGGTCVTGSPTAGVQDPAQNGMDESAFRKLAACNANQCTNGPGTNGYFITNYNTGPVYTTLDLNNNITYQGHGWQVFVAVIDTDCPPGPINQTHQLLTYSRLVITQVINNGYCAVQNHYPGNAWDANCPPPNGTGTRTSNLNAIFGYFSCAPIDSLPLPIPAPRAALGTKIKLVR
jgi:Flp pilus assembly protein TadG